MANAKIRTAARIFKSGFINIVLFLNLGGKVIKYCLPSIAECNKTNKVAWCFFFLITDES